MASVNRVFLVGNLGKDPEVRVLPSSKSACFFPLATTEEWVGEDGKQERTEWHNVKCFGKQAETAGQYLSKGRQVFVEGSIRSRSYDDKEGNKRYVTEIIAQRIEFLGKSEGKSGGGVSEREVADVFGSGDDVPF